MASKPAGGTEVLEDTEQKTKKPPMYKVLFHNDDYTTMEFVVSVLITIFHHNETRAVEIMLHVHQNGVGVAGVFTKEVAETKVAQTIQAARNNDYPLEVTIEPVD